MDYCQKLIICSLKKKIANAAYTNTVLIVQYVYSDARDPCVGVLGVTKILNK